MPTSDEVETKSEVRYTIPRFAKPSKRAQRLQIAINVALIALAVWQLSAGRIPLMPILALLASMYATWRIHSRGRDAVATTEGIHGPHLRHPIHWQDVECLIEPSRYDPEIYVVLTDRSRRGTGFPPDFFDRLTPLAGVPIKPYSPFD